MPFDEPHAARSVAPQRHFTPLTPRQPITATPYAITAGNVTGNAATATTATTANNFSGPLAGDVTGTQGATVVAKVGGQPAANVASGASAANAATSANTASTIVKRDASGNFAAAAITSGSVSIGTTNYGGPLFLVNSNTAAANNNTAAFYAPNLGPDHSHIHYGTTGDWYIRSATNTGKVVIQDTGGNVGIGTGNPQSKLHVVGTVTADNFIATAGPPAGMVLIPAGAFTMGDTLDGLSDAVPTNVTVSAFYMDVNLVSFSQWQTVLSWAWGNAGYVFDMGSGKAANHPVQTVTWYDAVKWCNARSEQAGLTPVYYTDAALTDVYRNGNVTPYAKWTANGYRLPTEAEWEKAARGGLNGKRFPWGNVITGNVANYFGDTVNYSYDLGPNGYNRAFTNGVTPYTSPVGSFAANGYGLNDMTGNLYEWCWDWYGTPYAGGSDPHGPASGSYRVLRGGSWVNVAYVTRCAYRGNNTPTIASVSIGFRCVRGL
ncbi:MAG: SUMF1/EgtB/PvdO family nonheme iron enzyme [Verrucomicrobiota bacterium]